MEKVIVFYRFTSIFLSVMILWLVGVNSTQSQPFNQKNEILVYILPDSLELPPGIQENIGIEQALKMSNGLSRAFQKMSIRSIGKAFPNITDSDTILVREDGRHIKLPQWSRVFKLTLNSQSKMYHVLEQLNREPSVLFAERAHTGRTMESNYSYSDQWHLNNTGQIGGSADISAPQAWQIFTGSPSVKLAIFDGGIDLNHDSFSNKISGDDAGDSHGTRVAGVAAARHNSGDIRGVDDKVQIISKEIKENQNTPTGWKYDFKPDYQIAPMIIEAINEGANVLNFSNSSAESSSHIRGALATAYKMDRVTVAAIGNQSSSTPRYPAAYPMVIAVGGTTQFDTKMQNSNTGSHINVTAPGHQIVTADWNNSYISDSGTSYAAPIVSGIATLLKGYNSSLNNDDIRRIIELSADKVTGMNGQTWTSSYGYGRVNAYETLKRLQSPYVVNHYTESGGTVHSNTSPYNKVFLGTSGLPDGVYIVKRYDVRKSVNLPAMNDREVWTRGAFSTGFSTESPNYGEGYADIVMLSGDNLTLRTYVYKVYQQYTGDFIGWFPTHPSNVEFAYTVHGITGAGAPPPPNTPTLTGTASNGMPHLSWNSIQYATSYKVNRISYHPQVSNTTFTTTNTSYTDGTLPFNVEVDLGMFDNIGYTVQAVNSSGESSPSNMVLFGEQGGGWLSNYQDGSDTIDKSVETVPLAFALHNNYPNPFNPTTNISYDIPEQSKVVLEVFDMMGRKISTLENATSSAGRYVATFNASQLSSGFYIARLRATSVNGDVFTQELKMQLVK